LLSAAEGIGQKETDSVQSIMARFCEWPEQMPAAPRARRRGILATALAAGIFLALHPAISGAPEASADPANAFRGVPFGTALEEVKKSWDLEPLTDEQAPGDPLRQFIRNDETKSLGGLAVQEIVYYFFADKFYAVGICTPDSRRTGILQRALEIAYGAPAPSAGSDSLVWPGKHASAQLIVNPSTGEGRALIFNNDLQADYEAHFSDAAKRAATEL
jgi:hypothetical protein